MLSRKFTPEFTPEEKQKQASRLRYHLIKVEDHLCYIQRVMSALGDKERIPRIRELLCKNSDLLDEIRALSDPEES